MFEFLKNNYPIEKYILSVLLKNKKDIKLAHKEIYTKYPFFKAYDLKRVISEILSKKVNNEKISGVWKRIEKRWKLESAYEWSGAEQPASNDENSIGVHLGTYTKPLGQPKNYEVPEQKFKHDPARPESVNDNELQMIYDELFDTFKNTFNDVQELNRVIVEELLSRGYKKVLRLKLRKET